ncbi:MAG TPA: FAD-binding protein, partial [Candidatus Sulfotelmatobacter sp.]|nr:FAD-binding protein [Candidatus Sulfotelmatobacter sp.]
MKGLPAETDFVVMGAGIAGLRAAIELAAAGRVLVLEKKDVSQPPAVTALSDEEEVILHLQDTLTAGDGLCNAAAVKILLEEGPQRIDELMAWGKSHRPALVFGLESAHSRHRSLHSQGESTGRE